MRFLSIPEAAKELNLCAATVRSRVKRGDWPFYPVGSKSIRVDIDEIRALLRSPGKLETQRTNAHAIGSRINS